MAKADPRFSPLEVGVSPELYDEIRDTLPVREVAFGAFDPKVARAAWQGEPVASGRFTRVLDALTDRIDSC